MVILLSPVVFYLLHVFVVVIVGDFLGNNNNTLQEYLFVSQISIIGYILWKLRYMRDSLKSLLTYS
jgi:hypothetical protein